MFFLLRLIIVLAVLYPGIAAEAAEQWIVVQEKSQIGFLVHSTMNTFRGKARAIAGGFEIDQALVQGRISVNVLELTTNNPQRDEHMYLMFEEAKYHQIYFNFKEMDLSQVVEGKGGSVTIKGEMTMHNVTQPLTQVAHAHWDGGVLICDGEFDVSLKDYGLHPPVMLMIMRVSNVVKVNYTIAFAKQGKAA